MNPIQMRNLATALFDLDASTSFNEVPTVARVRLLLNRVLSTDSGLDAFMIDNYRSLYRRTSNGMDRTAKMNILLSELEAFQIIDLIYKLREQFPDEFHKHKHALE